MSGYKKHPHVPCRSIHLRMDKVLEALECHVGMVGGMPCTCEGKDVLGVEVEELRKVLEYRGNVLSIQKRRGGRGGEYMTVTRENGS